MGHFLKLYNVLIYCVVLFLQNKLLFFKIIGG